MRTAASTLLGAGEAVFDSTAAAAYSSSYFEREKGK